jgi:hypothetical protein
MPLNSESPDDIAKALKLIGRIAKILANNPPRIQGAVLADLLATWIGGHFVPGDRKETSRASSVAIPRVCGGPLSRKEK